MEPTTTFGFLAARASRATGMESPTTEIQDFDRVMEVYWPRILRFVMASVRDRDTAETLTQDCFWNAYRSRDTFRGDSSLNTWLMRIAVNGVRKFFRNRRLQFWRHLQQSGDSTALTRESVCDGAMSPEASTLVGEQVRAVWDATKNLSQRQRTVFLLRFMEDMTVVEIAEATGLTVNSVNVHLFRAVRSVRKSMGENGMNKHLSHDQAARCLAGQGSVEEEEHGRSCLLCAAELRRFADAVSTFQVVMKDWSEEESFPRLKVAPAPPRWRRWALAGAAVAVLSAIPIYKQHPRPPDPEFEIRSDERLMEEVAAHLSRPLPMSMERVMVLLPAVEERNDPEREELR